MYKIQLHPCAAAFHITSKEAADKIVTLYRRFTRFGITAAPYFVYPIREELIKKYPRSYGAILCHTMSADKREEQTEALKVAIRCLWDREAGKYVGIYAPVFGMVSQEEAAAYREAEREALNILSLIEEYKALPA